MFCFYVILTEQYRTTKSSWLADYCKEEEQAAQAPPAMPWMGSSVDPPSLGQSECLHSPALHHHHLHAHSGTSMHTSIHLMSCHVMSSVQLRCTVSCLLLPGVVIVPVSRWCH